MGFCAMLEDFACKVGLSLEIVREQNFVGAGLGSVESYGIFTGGNTSVQDLSNSIHS